jgi:hypothetical protein
MGGVTLKSQTKILNTHSPKNLKLRMCVTLHSETHSTQQTLCKVDLIPDKGKTEF